MAQFAGGVGVVFDAVRDEGGSCARVRGGGGVVGTGAAGVGGDCGGRGGFGEGGLGEEVLEDGFGHGGAADVAEADEEDGEVFGGVGRVRRMGRGDGGHGGGRWLAWSGCFWMMAGGRLLKGVGPTGKREGSCPDRIFMECE